MVSIVLADRHPIVRQGLRQLLESEDLIQVTGEAGTGAEVMRLARKLAPRILIMDPSLPDMDGIGLMRQLSENSISTRVLIFSECGEESRVNEAVGNGAWGYLLKTTGIGELVLAVRSVATERHYPGLEIADSSPASRLHNGGQHTCRRQAAITWREREVLHLSAGGFSPDRIAARLGIRKSTAQTHRTNAMSKLGLHSQTELVRYALRTGFISI